jgi:hypothetical protein
MSIQLPILKDPLTQRYLAVKLILDKTCFVTSGTPEKIITQLTMDVSITRANGASPSSAQIIIKGMTLDDINSFSKINIYSFVLQENIVEVYAGYSLGSNGLPPLAYRGWVRSAGADLNNPDHPFTIISQTGIIGQMKQAYGISVKGVMSIADIFKAISNDLPYTLTLNHVDNIKITNPNYTGSALDQLKKVCSDYGYSYKINDHNITVTKIGTPYSDEVIEISNDNYLLGYPIVEEAGLAIRVWYTPTIDFGLHIKLKSIYKVANGMWYVNGISHSLQNRGKNWFSSLKLNKTNFRPHGPGE